MILNVKEAEERLRNYLLDGIATEIFWVDQTYASVREIGGCAEQINTADFGELFGSLQLILSDRHTLSIAKIFDPVKSYPTRSIPATLAILEKNVELWRVPQRRRLHQVLNKAGLDGSHVEQLSDAELTFEIVAHFRNTLPNTKRVGSDNLSLSLDALRQCRDKVIAHNEDIKLSALQQLTWGEATSLLNYAKEFVATIGFGYLNLFLGQGSDDYILTYDAYRTSIDLQRLLKAANIAADWRS